MSSVPPRPYRHPEPPSLPEVPEGVTPAPPPPSPTPPDERAGTMPPPFAWWSPFAALVVAYSLAVVAAILLGVVVGVAGGDVDANELPTGIVIGATMVQDVLLIVMAVVFARAGGIVPTPASFGVRRLRFARGLLWALAIFGAFYLFTLAWSLALQVTESDDLAQELGAEDSIANLVAVTVLVTIMAPLAEEVFFRGFLFAALWRWRGWVFGAVVSGLLFGVVHAGGTSAVFLVPLAVLGMLLCALYRWTGSLLPGMGLHAFNNALALGVTLEWAWWHVLLAVTLAPAVVVWIAAQAADRLRPRAPVPTG